MFVASWVFMTHINETHLPGVGAVHDFVCDSGDRVGVISHHGGRREVVVYDDHDPDRVSDSAMLSADEARVLADLLGGTTVTERLDHLRQEIQGLAIDWLPISPDSQYAGTTIAETALRNRTGVTIVAIVRDDKPLPAPGPEQTLTDHDTVVVIGTPDGIDAAANLLSTPAP